MGRMGRWIRVLFRDQRPGLRDGMPHRSQFQLLGHAGPDQSLALGRRLAKPDVDRRQHDYHYDHNPEYHPGRQPNCHHHAKYQKHAEDVRSDDDRRLVNERPVHSPADILANYRPPLAGVDHAVAVEGYQDDASLPSGGYWIIKNSWGTGGGDGTGYYDVPYGDLEIHGDIVAINTAVYYTGAMKTVTWTGAASQGTIWTSAAGTAYRNWSDGAAWVNQETQATFDATASNRTIQIINPVIAHDLIFNASGYSLNNDSNGALTVTAGGIQANQSVTINVPVTIVARRRGPPPAA